MRYFVIPIFLVLLLAPIILAQEQYTIDIYQEKGKLLIKESIRLNNDSEIIIPIQEDARSISSSTQYTIINNNLLTYGDNINISYITEAPLDKSEDSYYLSYKVTPQRLFDKTQVRLYLDEGFVVNKDEIYPKNYVLETDGKSIIVLWNFDKSSLIKNDNNIPLFVKIVSPSSYFIEVVLAIVLVLIIFSAIIFNLRKKLFKDNHYKRIHKKIIHQDYTKYLSESEKKVIEVLRNVSMKELWQKDIQRESGFSKAKLSRTIRNLEGKEIISRTPIGNTNKIRLKKR